MKRAMKGVTMIELMIVIAIIGILVAIVYPSYQDHVRRAARAEAHTNLLKMVDQQERYFLENNQYATTALLAYTPAEAAPVYTYAVTVGTPLNGFTITATTIGNQVHDTDCNTITITHAGTRGGESGAECW